MENIKIGDFIEGSYKFGVISGIVVNVLKNTVLINKCETYYNQCQRTEKKVKVTKSRIRSIGTIEGLGFKEVHSIDTNGKI